MSWWRALSALAGLVAATAAVTLAMLSFVADHDLATVEFIVGGIALTAWSAHRLYLAPPRH